MGHPDLLEPTGVAKDSLDPSARSIAPTPRDALPLDQKLKEATDAGENYFERERRMRPAVTARTIDLSLWDQFKLSVEQLAWREGSLGVGEAILYDPRTMAVDPQNPGDVAEYLRAVGIRDRQQLWERSTPPRNPLEVGIRIAGALGGGMMMPENFLGPTTKFVQGALTWPGRVGRAMLGGAGINMAIDPIIQQMRIKAGLQEHYEPNQTVMSGILGAAIPGVLQGGAELVRAAYQPIKFDVPKDAPLPPAELVMSGHATGQFSPVTIASVEFPEPKIDPAKEQAFRDYATKIRSGIPTTDAELRDAVETGFLDPGGRLTPRGLGVLSGDAEVPPAPARPDVAPDVQTDLPPERPPAVAPEVPSDAEVRTTTTAPIRQAPAPEAIPPTPGERAGVFMFDPQQLQIDAQRFQFKEGGDQAGVTPLLKGVTTWDPDAAGQLIVWERADGARFVADGHQRVALAQRLMSETALGSTLPTPRPGLTPVDQAALESDLTSIVRQITGKNAAVSFEDTIPVGRVSAFAASDARTAGGTVSLFSNGEALVRIAVNDPSYDPANSAAHEAFHVVEMLLLNDDEYARLTDQATMLHIRRLAEDAVGKDKLAGVPDYELRAIAFAYYRQKRDVSGLPKPLQAIFEKLRAAIDSIRKAFADRGYKSMTDIFDATRAGEFAKRPAGEARLELMGLVPQAANQTRIPNPIHTWHGTPHTWGPEYLVQWPDASLEYVTSARLGMTPALPKDATVIARFPKGRARIGAETARTGEGNAAFGEGLYSAEVRDTADKGYRERLTRGQQNVTLPADLSQLTRDDVLIAFRDTYTKRGREVLISRLERELNGRDGFGKGDVIAASAKYSLTAAERRHIDQQIKAAISYMKRGGEMPAGAKAGSLYELAIHAQKDRFLDWDASLADQPAKVKAALESLGIPTEEQFVGDIDPHLFDYITARFSATKRAYSEVKKYLTTEMAHGRNREIRPQFETALAWLDRNRESLQKLRSTVDTPWPRTGAGAMKRLGPDAERLLNEKGIVGSFHLDRSSRDIGQGTHNYVVFAGNEGIVEVLSVGSTVTRDTGDIRIPGSLYRETDGFSAEDVMAIAALKNIREGSGSVMDAARFLRLRPGQAGSIAEIGRATTRQAVALTNLTDEAWRMTVNGIIDPADAAVIGRLIPADKPDLQDAAARAITRLRPVNPTETDVLVRRVMNADLMRAASGAQTSFLDDFTDTAVVEEVRIMARAIQVLGKDKNLLTRVEKNAAQIEDVGSSRIDRTAARQGAVQAAQLSELIQRSAFTHGPVRASLRALARDVVDGTRSSADAVDAFLTEIKSTEKLFDTGPGATGKVTDNEGGPATKPQASLFGEDVQPASQVETPTYPGTTIKGYHWSPAKFGQFDPAFIGSGEGIQAYGYGFSFGTEPRTALRMRETILTGRGLDPEKSPGGLYEVGIHASPSEFVDWGRTVYADALEGQSPTVRRALVQVAGTETVSGEKLAELVKTPETAALLARNGVVGVRSGNEIVVFAGNESRIEIRSRTPDIAPDTPPPDVTPVPEERVADQYVRELTAARPDVREALIARLESDPRVKKADAVAIASRLTGDLPKSTTKAAAIERLRNPPVMEMVAADSDRVRLLRESGAMNAVAETEVAYVEAMRLIDPLIYAAEKSDVYTTADMEWMRAIRALFVNGQRQTEYVMGQRGGKPPIYRIDDDASLAEPSAGLLERMPPEHAAILGRLYEHLDRPRVARAESALNDLYEKMTRANDDASFVDGLEETYSGLTEDLNDLDQFNPAMDAIDAFLGSDNGRFYPERRRRLDQQDDKLRSEIARLGGVVDAIREQLLQGGAPSDAHLKALGILPDSAVEGGTVPGTLPPAIPKLARDLFGIPVFHVHDAMGSARDVRQALMNMAAYARKNGIQKPRSESELARSIAVSQEFGETFEYSQGLRGRPMRGDIGRPQAGIAAGPDVPPAQKLSDISDQTKRALGMTVRQGRLRARNRNVLGEFNRLTGVTRLRQIDAFDVLTHEAGHHLNFDPRFSTDVIAMIDRHTPEMEGLAYAAAQGRGALTRAEGFAEWFRLYLTNPGYAQREAPAFSAEMQQWLQTAHPDLARQFEQVQAAYSDWRQASSTDMIIRDLATSGQPPWTTKAGRVLWPEKTPTGQNLFSFADRLYTWTLDRHHPVNKLVQGLLDLHYRNTGERLDLKYADNPYALLRLAVSAYQAGHLDLRHGVTRYRGVHPEGPSVVEAMELALGKNWYGNWRTYDKMAFDGYLVARRSIVEYRRFEAREVPNPPGKFSLGDYQRAVAELEAANPNFAQAAQMIYEWNANMLRKKRDAGFITQAAFDRLINKEDYVPMFRDFDKEFYDKVIGSHVSGDNRQAIMRQYKGSLRSVISPIESMIDESYRLNARIAVNDIIGAIADLAERVKGYGGFLAEEIPATRMVGYEVDIVRALKASGKDGGLSSDEVTDLVLAVTERLDSERLMATLYKTADIENAGDRIVYFYRGGKRRALQLADGAFGKELFEAVTGLGKEQSNVLIDVISKPATALRTGITTEPTFLISNYIRDQVQAFILNTRFVPFISGARGMLDEILGKDMARIYAYKGGIMGGANVASLDDTRFTKDVNSFRKNGWSLQRFKDPREILKLTELSETGTRVALFRQYFETARARGLTEHEAAVEAAFQARDFTDFGRHGSKTLMLRRMIPFFNAGLQGTDKSARVLVSDLVPLARVFKGQQLTDTEKRHLVRSVSAWVKITTVTLLGSLLALMNKDDPEWQAASEYTRATHWLFKKPNGDWVAVPKGFELATIYNLGERLTEGIASHDQTWADRWLRSFSYTLAVPHEPTALMVPAELMFNYDRFQAQQIVPEWDTGLEPWLQYNAYTSEFSKMVGRAVNVSPAMIDHAIVGFTGTWGRDALAVSNYVSPQRRSSAQYDWPFFGRFVKNLARGSDATDKFYKEVANVGGRLSRARDSFIKIRDKDANEAGAMAYYDSLPDDQKVWVASTELKTTDEKRVHPMRRAADLMEIYSALRKGITSGVLKDTATGQLIQVNPTIAWELSDQIARLSAVEARNALIVVGQPGWAQREIAPTQPYLDAIRQLSPEVYAEMETRMRKKKVLPFEGVAAVWPEYRDRLLEQGFDTYAGDLRIKALAYTAARLPVTTRPSALATMRPQ